MAQTQETQHALLIPWGHFAREIGLISGIEAVKLSQKVYEHTLQTKVIEFLVAILSGAKYLQDVSLAAHPLDKDVVVAQAWGQPGWADYTGVSRTLQKLSWAEAHTLVEVLERVSQPMIESELALLRAQGRRLEYDGDLTGLPVSNTSRTYPNAAYGHMSDEIQLGYQAGVVSLPDSPAYGRLWISVDHHAGIPSLAHKPQRCCGQRPKRRTELLQQRIEAQIKSRAPAWRSSQPSWQRRNAQKRKCPHNGEQKRSQNASRFSNLAHYAVRNRSKLPAKNWKRHSHR